MSVSVSGSSLHRTRVGWRQACFVLFFNRWRDPAVEAFSLEHTASGFQKFYFVIITCQRRSIVFPSLGSLSEATHQLTYEKQKASGLSAPQTVLWMLTGRAFVLPRVNNTVWLSYLSSYTWSFPGSRTGYVLNSSPYNSVSNFSRSVLRLTGMLVCVRH